MFFCCPASLTYMHRMKDSQRSSTTACFFPCFFPVLIWNRMKDSQRSSTWACFFFPVFFRFNLKQNEAQSAHAESTHKGVNQPSKYATPVQQQRPELPTVTLTWHACKYKVHKLFSFFSFLLILRMYPWWSLCILYLHACLVRVTTGDSDVCCCTCVKYFTC